MKDLSFFEREYENAVKYGNFEYQWRLISNEIRQLQERQRTIERARQRAIKEGVDESLIDYTIRPEFELNKKSIEMLKTVRQETKERIKAEKQNAKDLPKVRTYKVVQYAQREGTRAEKEKKETPKASQRTLPAKIKKGVNEAIEELIQRMFFKGKFLTLEYQKLEELSNKYKWVFDILGFSLSDLFRQDVAKNYSDYSSATAFDFFNEVIDEQLNDTPKNTYEKDGVEYVDPQFEHTVEEYEQAIREIVAEFKK